MRPLLKKALSTETVMSRSDGPLELLQEEEKEYVAQGIMEALSGHESNSRLVVSKLVKKYG